MEDKKGEGLFGITLPQDKIDETIRKMLKEIEEKEKGPQEKEGKLEEKVQEPVEGLLIADDMTLKLYDFSKKRIEKIARFPDALVPVYSMEFHDNELYMGGWRGIWNIKNKKEIIPRASFARSLFSYEGKLFDAGAYGLLETLTNKEHVSKQRLIASNLHIIEGIFLHEGKPMALIWNEENEPLDIYNLHYASGKLTLGKLYKKIHNSPKNTIHATAVSIQGHILTNLSFNCFEIRNSEIEKTLLCGGKYDSLIYDQSRNKVYASGRDICEIQSFEIKTENGKIDLEPERNLISGGKFFGKLSNCIFALLPVTKDQMKIVRGN